MRALGSEISLTGDTFDVANAEAERLCAEHGYTFVPPYDDPEVIAGQGTIGMEILRQHGAAIDAISCLSVAAGWLSEGRPRRLRSPPTGASGRAFGGTLAPKAPARGASAGASGEGSAGGIRAHRR